MRLCIFSFYDKDGVVDYSVEYLLQELSTVVDRLIVVVNGYANKDGFVKLHRFSQEIIIRENLGFDAGAYRGILIDYMTQEELHTYDELILCNDTFFGPIEPFERIFEKMGKEECDFWGLCDVSWPFRNHIQSYFFVFEGNILRNQDFYDYWKNQIDGKTKEVEDVYAKFENGLFNHLTQHMKKKYATYACVHNHDIYYCPSVAVRKDNLPLVKKKCIKKPNFDMRALVAVMRYLEANTSYPTQIIVDYCKRNGIDVEDAEINKISDDWIEPEQTCYDFEIDDLWFIKRLEQCDSYYIYGSGVWARNIYWCWCQGDTRFKGFLTSDKPSKTALYGHPVSKYDAANIDDMSDIILGTNKNNTIEIRNSTLANVDKERLISMFPSVL